MKLYPLPTPGFQSGSANLIFNSDNPQDQRKDNLRFDYRLGTNHSFTYRYSKYNWMAIDAFRGTFPFARTDWDRPNKTMNVNWTWTISNNLINEASYSYSIDQVFINVFTETGLYKRSRTGVNYPYIYPGKEIEDKIPTINIDSFTTIDGGPYPSSSEGPIHLWSDTPHLGEGPAHVEGGRRGRVVGRGRLRPDQRQLDSRAAPTTRTASSTSATARAGGRASASPTWRWGSSPTTRRSASARFTNWRALATDIFVQDSWRPTQRPDDRGRHPLRDLAAVVLDDEQHRQLRSAVLRQEQRGGDQPGDGPHHLGPALQRHRPARRRVRRRGQRSEGRERPGRAGALPRRAARLLARRTTT